MILNVESSTKLPTTSRSDSQLPTPVSPLESATTYSQSTYISYATFPASNPRQTVPNTLGPGTDISALLGLEHPELLSDDEQPPSYEEIDASRRSRSRFWTWCAVLGLMCLAAFSVRSSYQFTKGRKSIPSSPSRPLPDYPSTSTLMSPPTSISSEPPASSEYPPPPPIEISFPYDPPFIPPEVGRTDLCRPWAYSHADGYYSVRSDKPTIEKLLYKLPALAPIHLETLNICSAMDGSKGSCNDYEGPIDSVPGKLHVVAADIELPTVELAVQRSSELGIAGISLCMMKRPLDDGSGVYGESFKWSFEIYIWKDPTSPSWNSMLTSLSILVTLPSAHVHDLTTRLNFFTQIIGPVRESLLNRLSFGNLQLAGDSGRIEVRNTNARVINGRSSDSSLLVIGSRISSSLTLESTDGFVESNATLVHTEPGSPVRVDLKSEAGVVNTIVDLDYPLSSVVSPLFEIKTWSRYSRALLYMTDHQGTRALQNHSPSTLLPTIQMNLTSELAIAQALLPVTYSGSMEVRSQHADTGTVDRAKDLTGRSVEWHTRDPGLVKGDVRWIGTRQTQKGSLRITTEFAAARLLFFGFDESLVETWPKELTEWRVERAGSRTH